MTSAREKPVEDHLVHLTEKLGGISYKLDRIPGRRDRVDRLVILPGRVLFVECKPPKRGRYSALQTQVMDRLRELGCEVASVKTKQEVEDLVCR